MGVQKLLLPLAGKPVIAHLVDAFLRSPVARVLVVVGPADEPIRQVLAGRQVEFVVNPRPEGEMLESVRCALREIPADTSGVAVTPGDLPGLSPEIIAGLVHAFESSNRGIVVPAANGRRGHPIVFSTRFCEEVLTGYDQVGLRGLLQAHAKDVFEVETGAWGVVEDLDTPEDYLRAVETFSGNGQQAG